MPKLLWFPSDHIEIQYGGICFSCVKRILPNSQRWTSVHVLMTLRELLSLSWFRDMNLMTIPSNNFTALIGFTGAALILKPIFKTKMLIYQWKNLSTRKGLERAAKGAVIKYGTEGGGRDLTGSPKILDGKCWANKLLQVINMGHEAICFRICFNIYKSFKHCQRYFCCSFDHWYHSPFHFLLHWYQEVLSCLLKALYSHKCDTDSMIHRKKFLDHSVHTEALGSPNHFERW